jgi:hypothetical protein
MLEMHLPLQPLAVYLKNINNKSDIDMALTVLFQPPDINIVPGSSFETNH